MGKLIQLELYGIGKQWKVSVSEKVTLTILSNSFPAA